MAGLLASYSQTLPAPCAHHSSALPTLKFSSAFFACWKVAPAEGRAGSRSEEAVAVAGRHM